MSSKQKIYLDYAATTPVDPEVVRAMRPYFGEKFGNPGSLHSFGQEAIATVDRSRETIANAIGAEFREIIFTGSATEANNLALRGSIRGLTQTIRRLTQKKKPTQKTFSASQRSVSVSQRPRLIISAVEHESVLETARDLEKDGVEIVIIPINRFGVIDLKKLKAALNDRAVLVSIMYANNEIGTVQPIREISKLISEFKKQKAENKKNSTFSILDSTFPLLHTDAVQAFQFLDCNVQNLGVDVMTLSAHKIYGPKGVGALYIHKPSSTRRQLLMATTTGGGQEFGLRSGTENVPNIVGFAKAVEMTEKLRAQAAKRVGALRDSFWHGIREIYPKAEAHGIREPFQNTLPNILNVYSPDFLAEELVMRLDMAGVAASSGSACSSRSSEPSHVIQALGYAKERAKRSIRFSFGKPTTLGEIKKALKIVQGIIKKKSLKA